MHTSLPLRHLLLALAVVVVWGTNFVVIKLALAEMPPLLIACLRFALAVFPAIFFLPRPVVPWINLMAYGVLIGVGQFGLLFVAMNGHISPGLASLVIQVQVFFTIGLAMRISGERLQLMQWIALVLAAIGIGTIVVHTDGTTTLLGLTMIVLAAASWAGGNIVSRQAGKINMVAYVVWSSIFAVPPLAALCIAIEGWDAVTNALRGASASTWGAVGWQAWGNSLFGYAAWGWLLSRHPASTITPMALLVPLFGMASSAWWLGEALPAWKLTAAALVMVGLAMNLLWPRLRTGMLARRGPSLPNAGRDDALQRPMFAVWISGLAAAVLLAGLTWYLEPLQPNIVALQFSYTPKTFGNIVHLWPAEHLVRFRVHLPFDCLLLFSYGWFGFLFATRTKAFSALNQVLRALATWALPMAAISDAIENGLHWWLTEAPRFGVPVLYEVATVAAALKWALIAFFFGLVSYGAFKTNASD
jgi:O-acetylserine/cysteine efflux transporter